MKKVWFETAWSDYLYWQSQDRRTLKKINLLLQDVERNGYNGIGKPEPLKSEFSGWWSLRIDEKNRLVFRMTEKTIEIAACRGHYDTGDIGN
ncbi:MAG: Txe/YoeB family addiction module toxin [Synergistaceae bacterium]|jgi:toxin YoeB|nr:Txe/YoeB family addiction module toxin [Synergistaceae bacterium]